MGGVWREGGRGRLYTYRYTVITRMTPETKMGSVESHFNVSLIVRDKVTGQPVSTNHDLFEEKREPKRNRGRGPSAFQPNALTLGQTGSQQNNEAACEIEEAVLSCWPKRVRFSESS